MQLAAGGEYQDYIHTDKVIRKSKSSNREQNRYYDRTQAHLSIDVKKKVYFQEHIWTDI